MVLGHGQCGGIRAALEGGDLGMAERSFVDDWMTIVSEARDHVLATCDGDRQLALEQEAIKVSMANLRTFPFIAERESAGALKLHGGWFAIASGELHVLDEADGTFRPAT